VLGDVAEQYRRRHHPDPSHRPAARALCHRARVLRRRPQLISAETLAELEARRLLYILGVRERTDKLARELVLDDPSDHQARQAGRLRCHGGDAGATSSAATIRRRRRTPPIGTRSSPLSGASAREGRQSARRQFPSLSEDDQRREHFAIDPAKVEEDKVSTASSYCAPTPTSTRSKPCFATKQLWTVEQTFRAAKYLLSTRGTVRRLAEWMTSDLSNMDLVI
jgi:hypothetical protein